MCMDAFKDLMEQQTHLLTQLLQLLRHGNVLVEVLKHGFVFREEGFIAVFVPAIFLVRALSLVVLNAQIGEVRERVD